MPLGTENKIESIFQDSLESLGNDYCNHAPLITTIDESELPSRAAAFLGFGGDGVRGNVGVLGDPQAVASVWSTETTLDPADWLRELSNQVVGRFKNRLLKFGKTVQMGTPVMVTGEMISLSEGGDQTLALRAEVDGVELFVTLAFDVEAGCVLEEIEAVQIAEEGSISLF